MLYEMPGLQEGEKWERRKKRLAIESWPHNLWAANVRRIMVNLHPTQH